MASTTTRAFAGLVLIGALTALPASAEQRQRRRNESDRARQGSSEQADRGRGRATPSTDVQAQSDRQNGQGSQQAPPRQLQAQRQADVQPQSQVSRQYQAPPPRNVQPQYNTRSYNTRSYDTRHYDTRHYDNGPRYAYRGYGPTYVVPRVIYPRVVTVVPYRPYVYRPSFSLGVYYGVGGSYPYGYTPRGYYDPIPGRPYGGLRITGAPREAHVFADGYYVGIVNDFDGVFQHLNLEAGGHRIGIEVPGYEPIEFNVMVLAGQTTTFRADVYSY